MQFWWVLCFYATGKGMQLRISVNSVPPPYSMHPWLVKCHIRMSFGFIFKYSIEAFVLAHNYSDRKRLFLNLPVRTDRCSLVLMGSPRAPLTPWVPPWPRRTPLHHPWPPWTYMPYKSSEDLSNVIVDPMGHLREMSVLIPKDPVEFSLDPLGSPKRSPRHPSWPPNHTRLPRDKMVAQTFADFTLALVWRISYCPLHLVDLSRPIWSCWISGRPQTPQKLDADKTSFGYLPKR